MSKIVFQFIIAAHHRTRITRTLVILGIAFFLCVLPSVLNLYASSGAAIDVTIHVLIRHYGLHHDSRRRQRRRREQRERDENIHLFFCPKIIMRMFYITM